MLRKEATRRFFDSAQQPYVDEPTCDEYGSSIKWLGVITSRSAFVSLAIAKANIISRSRSITSEVSDRLACLSVLPRKLGLYYEMESWLYVAGEDARPRRIS